MEWLYVTAGLEAQEWMEGLEDVWRGLGGKRIVIHSRVGSQSAEPPAGVEFFLDASDTFDCWCIQTNLTAVLVRPDRYVYAAIRCSAELVAKVRKLAEKSLKTSNGGKIVSKN